MHTKDGFNCCYNVQTAVDSTSHLIAEYEVTDHNTDQGLLCQTADKAKELLVMDVIEVVADKGYYSRKDILIVSAMGLSPTSRSNMIRRNGSSRLTMPFQKSRRKTGSLQILR